MSILRGPAQLADLQGVLLCLHPSFNKERKNYKIDSTDDKKKDQKNPAEGSPVENGRFRLAESDCIRNGLTYVVFS